VSHIFIFIFKGFNFYNYSIIFIKNYIYILLKKNYALITIL
jgi:hypothetical protein